MSNGYAATEKEAGLYLTITALYEQQKYMYGRIEKYLSKRITRAPV